MKTRIMLLIAITLVAWQVAAEVRNIICSKSIGPEKYGQETGQSY